MSELTSDFKSPLQNVQQSVLNTQNIFSLVQYCVSLKRELRCSSRIKLFIAFVKCFSNEVKL